MQIKNGANPYDYAVDFVVAITIVDPLHVAQVNNQVFLKPVGVGGGAGGMNGMYGGY